MCGEEEKATEKSLILARHLRINSRIEAFKQT